MGLGHAVAVGLATLLFASGIVEAMNLVDQASVTTSRASVVYDGEAQGHHPPAASADGGTVVVDLDPVTVRADSAQSRESPLRQILGLDPKAEIWLETNVNFEMASLRIRDGRTIAPFAGEESIAIAGLSETVTAEAGVGTEAPIVPLIAQFVERVPAELALPPGEASATPVARGPASERAVSAQRELPPAFAAHPGMIAVLAGMALALFAAFYSRIHDGRLLDQEVRERIYRSVVERRTVVATELARELSLNRTTVMYHLRRLSSAGLVRSARIGRAVAWVPIEETPRASPLAVSAPARRVYGVIVTHPGVTRAQIARELGITSAHVRYHLGRLVEAGDVRVDAIAGDTRYAVAAPAT